MRLWLVVISFFLSLSAYASEYNYRNYWKETKLQNEKVKLSVFVKNSPVPGLRNLAMATVSSGSTDSLEKVVATYKKVVGTKKWIEQEIDGLKVYESYDPESFNVFRVAYNPKNNQFSYGSVKLRYLLPSYVELHMLQVEKLTGQSSKSTAGLIFQMLVPEAQAVDWARYDGYLQRTSAEVKNYFNDALRTGKRATGALEKAADNLGDIADGLTPKNAARMALVATATAAATSAFISVAGSLGWEAINRAFLEIIGAYSSKEQERAVQLFHKSFGDFRELSPKLADYEKQLTHFASLLSSITEKDIEENMAKLSEVDENILQAERDLAELGPANNSNPDVCQQIDHLTSLINQMKGIRSKLVSMGSDKNEACVSLDKLYQDYLQMEESVTAARLNIVRNGAIFVGVLNKGAESETASQEKRKNENACDAKKIQAKIDELVPQANDKGCFLPRPSNHDVCKRLRGYVNSQQGCVEAIESEVSESLLASRIESVGNLSLNIGLFVKAVSQLDCAKNGPGKSCLDEGPYMESKRKLESLLSGLTNKCPDQGFSKSMVATQQKMAVLAKTVPVSSQAPSPSSSANESGGKGLWSWVKSLFGPRPQNSEAVANQYRQHVFHGSER